MAATIPVTDPVCIGIGNLSTPPTKRVGSPLASRRRSPKLESRSPWGRTDRKGDETVNVGTTDTMLLYGAGAWVGPEPTSSYAATPTYVGAASGPAAATSTRMQQLLAGAAPANDAERQLLQRVETIMQGVVGTLRQIAAEGVRQARLGRDVYGRPLQRSEDHAFEQRVLDLVNVERARHGLAPLAYNRQLDAASEAHTRHMAAVQRMAHDGIGDGDPGSRILAQGFDRSWGENVATGQLTPEQVVAEWMASPGHRRNILDPEFRQLGVAYGTAANGRTYWAQSFGG